ncbi:tetratricopeptide repeat protein [Desulfoluna butyratoxydans]|uniref:Tetratricopeptide repeat n=1 Tax=Desulfoluna butyratoxydans TaxID=231438 RepID=A0A4U8YS43_9BACT|nr:tetratricopeptide repeat protein [Desulfoluna butyratoxydans]VFQ46159.1 tetratricopeptide repeat [Desulfoluna butyratoxydans]
MTFIRLFFYKRFALNAFVLQDYEKALTYFGKIAALCPDTPGAYYNMGLCLMGLKRFEEAEAAFKEDVRKNGMSHERCRALGDLGYLWGKKENAITWYERCRALSDDHPDSPWLDRRLALIASVNDMAPLQESQRLLEEGIACMAKKKNAVAESAFEKAVAKDPTNIQALNNLGVLRMEVNRDPEGAAACFRQITTLSGAPLYAENLKKALKSES